MTNVSQIAAIDSIIQKFYAAFDNRIGASPNAQKLCEYFTDGATITHYSDNGQASYSVPEFARSRVELLTNGTLQDFHKYETGADTTISGLIAIRASRYRKSGILNGAPYSGSGSKCFQLINLKCGWRIAALGWLDD